MQHLVVLELGCCFAGSGLSDQGDVPSHLARFGIKRKKTTIDRTDKDLAIADRHAAIGWTAAHLRRGPLMFVAPYFASARRVDGRDMIKWHRKVENAIDFQWRRLERRADAGLIDPAERQLLDCFAVNLVEWGKAL